MKNICIVLMLICGFSCDNPQNKEEIKEIGMSSIRITHQPLLKSYFIGEPLSLEGLKVIGIDNENNTIPISTEDLKISGFSSDIETLDSLIVNVLYKEHSASFKVSILPFKVDLSTMTLKEYVGTSEQVCIPKRIKHIGDYVFAAGYTKIPIKDVNIPNGVESVGEFSFFRSLISKIVLPQSITKIEPAAFRETGSLKMVDMSKCHLTHLSEEIFNGSSVENILLPSTLEVIEVHAFLNASKLVQLKLPENVVVIKNSAFRDSGLKTIEIPNYVYCIEENAFAYCESLERVLTYGSRISQPIQQVKYLGSYAFVDCKKLECLEIPMSLTRIDGSVAINLPLLKEITLHENIRSLMTRAFLNSALKKVTILTDFPPEILLRDWESEAYELFPSSVSEIIVTSNAYRRYKTNHIWTGYFDKMRVRN